MGIFYDKHSCKMLIWSECGEKGFRELLAIFGIKLLVVSFTEIQGRTSVCGKKLLRDF